MKFSSKFIEIIIISKNNPETFFISNLGLIKKWEKYGNPIVVGSVAYDLVVTNDIDIEIYCQKLKIEDGFDILKQCSLVPGVYKTTFQNMLNMPDKALYWQLKYIDEENEDWKIDMWSAPLNYNLPRSIELIEPMKKALTKKLRIKILEIKEQLAVQNTIKCPSIDLYRAVIENDVSSLLMSPDFS